MLGMPRILEHASALQVFRAVQSAGEPEMTAQVGAGVMEGAEDGIGFGRHKANIAVTFLSRVGQRRALSSHFCHLASPVPFCTEVVPFW
jgi:hypothetical protein